MLSPPLRGRPAGLAESRPPAYRRSTSLGVAAASPVRTRPASMVTLSTGRSVLAPPMPRRDYDPSLSRALAALEVPGAHVPRVLQGRRLYTSSSSTALGSAGSSVRSSSPSSPVGLPSDFRTLRLRPKPPDPGRLMRSRSGIFGELKKPEVPLTRTRTTAFGSRAGSVLREEKDGELDGGRTLQRRPWSATVAENTVMLQDVTSDIRNDVSPGRTSGGESCGRSVAGSVSPRQSVSRASAVNAETGSVEPAASASTTHSGASGTAESKPPLGKDLGVAGVKGKTGAGSDRSGKEKSTPSVSVRVASIVELPATGTEPSGSSQENGDRQSQRATSEVGTVCEPKQGTAPTSEPPRLTVGDKQAAFQEEKQTSKQNETAHKTAKIKPGCLDRTDKTVVNQAEDAASVDPTTSQSSRSLEKPLAKDVTSVSGQHSVGSTQKQEDTSKNFSETDLPVTISVKSKQLEKEQTLKAEKEQVNKSAGVPAGKTDKVRLDRDTSGPAAEGHPSETNLGVEPSAKVKKVKKKKVTNKLLNAEKEEASTVKDSSKTDEPDEKAKNDCDERKEEPDTKKIEVKDDINNNIYMKKFPTDNHICMTKTTQPARQLTMPKTNFTGKPTEVDSVFVNSQDCRSARTSKPDTKTATNEKCATIPPSNESTATKAEEANPSPCSATKSLVAERSGKEPSQVDGKADVGLKAATKHEDGDFGSTEKCINTEIAVTDSSAESNVTIKPSAKTADISPEKPEAKDKAIVSTAPEDGHSLTKAAKRWTMGAMNTLENEAKRTATPKPTATTFVESASIPPTQPPGKNKLNTAAASKDTLSRANIMGTVDKLPANSEVTSKTSTASPPKDSRSPEKVTVTCTVGGPHAELEPHWSDSVGVDSAAGAERSAATVTPSGTTSAGDKPGQEQNTAVKHRDLHGRKSGLTDEEKALKRNAAVIGDRLIVGEIETGVPCIPGKQEIETPQSGDKHVENCSPSGLSRAGVLPVEKQPAKHKLTVMQNGAGACDTTTPAKNNKFSDSKMLPKMGDQKPLQTKQETDDSSGTAVLKKKVKIVKKKTPLSSEAKQIKLTTIEPVNKLHFPAKNLTHLSPFLRADQEKKNSKEGKMGVTDSKSGTASVNDVKQNGGADVSTGKLVKLRKKKTSKTPNVSKRSEKHRKLEVQDNKTKHSVETACDGSKRVVSGGLTPSAGNSKSGTKKATKGRRSSSVRLDTDKLKSKSEHSSSSESCSSSEYDSEEDLSPLERAKRKIREEKERDEARKIEKFRRRGQRAKLKMERLKMEDDPEEYMKTPGNLRFAFMIKQDEWMRKREEAQQKEAEASQLDGAPPAGPVTSLRDGLTSSGAGRRPSADIDESPFDRRLGPLGGPPPKFRQYALEDFRLLRVLGKGAFGKVMLARMKDTRNYFAIKCLRKDKILNDEDVEDTLIERKILTLGTNHPYLCHLFCTFQSPSHLFFVLEFLNGGDLNFHLGQMGRFSPELTRFYASELVCGLRFLHKRGIIYRDLKLDNVLLDHEGHVRIADFGMCKMQIFLDRTADAFCGTVDYMAPEVVSGKNYNQSVDWWSFGIMLYEMLVGLTPFIGLDEDELFWAIRTEQPFYPRFLEPDATEIIKWLLVKDPALRLGSPECPAGGICSQPFFRRVDWYLVERKQHDPPPFRPTLLTMADCRYFEDDYTALPARLTDIPDDVLSEVRQDRFANFDYTNPNMTD